MVRSLAIAACAAAVAVTAVAGAAGEDAATAERTFGTRGAISRLSADGARVAVLAAGSKRRCARVVVFTIPTRRSETFDVRSMCPGSDQPSGPSPRVDALVLSGDRVAWLQAGGGNKLELVLKGAALGSRRQHELAFVTNAAGAEGGLAGEWVTHVAGGGGLLAYSAFSLCETESELGDCYEEDPTPPLENLKLEDVRLVRVERWRQPIVARGVRTLSVVAAYGDLIAVRPLKDTEPVEVLDTRGRRVGRITIPSAPWTYLVDDGPFPYALDGDTLVVKVRNAVERYRARDGALVKHTALPANLERATLHGASAGLAAVGMGGKVHVVRLSDGKRAVFSAARSRAPGIVAAELEATGLFYAYNVRSTTSAGRVTFVPRAEIFRKLR